MPTPTGEHLRVPTPTGEHLRVPTPTGEHLRVPTPTGEHLRVLFDATAIPADRGGVGRYVESVVAELVLAGVPLAVVCQPRDRAWFEAAGVTRVIEIAGWGGRASGRLLWEQLALPGIARRAGARAIHSPHYTFPVFTRRARIVTVHDLTFFSAPEVHGLMKRVFFRSWIRAAKLARATVVTPSQTTADEYVRVTGAPATRVFAAPLGYDSSVFHPPTPAEVERFEASLERPVPAGWIAFLGTLEPRKNVSALVRGYVGATKARPPAERPALLIAGGAGWDETVAGTVSEALEAGFDIRMLGYLPLEKVRSLLGGSLLTAYPSLGEGFGLPVLEAMACGSCVLTTRRLSLPEVGGAAVSYTDVDSASIAEALARLLDSPSERAELGLAGRSRAARFTWAACAARHVLAYRSALGLPGSATASDTPGMAGDSREETA
ncbi:glycosyltransferase family 4 protein [Subtercola boreus]|uniref:glycosyltransferase family 4 protein n=1 Tax=Subtercola boreus TaxID=120213 RepID=UPI00209C14F2|nr:glycosyltransferase family 1 protein [Subtercola boreus]